MSQDKETSLGCTVYILFDWPLQQHGESYCDKYMANLAGVKCAISGCQGGLSTEPVLLGTTHLVHFTEAALAEQVHEQVAAVQHIMRLEPALLLISRTLQSPVCMLHYRWSWWRQHCTSAE